MKEKKCVHEICKSEEQWRKDLGTRYEILRGKGTEPAFSGKLLHNTEKGVYLCGGCGNEIFSSDQKFDSNSGWPSFFEAISPGKVQFHEDNSYGMRRVEVLCNRCGSHLGHFFRDGPKKARYCINSEALDFKKK
jgi:peptide-methionine (R)-S-oxide reductase